MGFLRSALILSAAHLLSVVALFLVVGLGLEGRPSSAHHVLWFLLEPLVSLPPEWIPPPLPIALLPLNSAVWGFGGAAVLGRWRRLRAN
jgi:hypothetical protein